MGEDAVRKMTPDVGIPTCQFVSSIDGDPPEYESKPRFYRRRRRPQSPHIRLCGLPAVRFFEMGAPDHFSLVALCETHSHTDEWQISFTEMTRDEWTVYEVMED